MSKESIAKGIELKGFDELFGVSGANEIGNIQNVLLSDLHPFKNHPFYQLDDGKMDELVDSIKKHGVLVPGIVRKRPEGGYEIVAGHNRREACKRLGMTSMPMIVRDLNDEEAIIIMVDSNIQREDLRTSEKAKAYKMKYDAMKRQGAKGNSLDQMVKEAGENAKQIQRYVWLGRLNDELLMYVDDKVLPKGQALDISFLKRKEQEWVKNAFEKNANKLTTVQSRAIKNRSLNGVLTQDMVEEIIAQKQTVRMKDVIIKKSIVNEYFDASYTNEMIQKTIIELLENWKMSGNR